MVPIVIAQKNLLHIIRNLKSWWFLFALPIVFISIFAFIFGSSNDNIQFELVTNYSDSVNEQAFPGFINGLQELKNTSGNQLFNISYVESLEEGYSELKDGDTDIMVTFENTKIVVEVDRFNTQGQAASAIIGEYLAAYFGINQENFEVKSIALGRDYASPFEYLVPGLIIYGILNLLPQVTIQLADELRRRHVFRYFSAGVRGWEVILGHSLSFVVTGGFQIVLMFIAIALFGYSIDVQLLPLLVVIVLSTFLVLGIGFCIGAMTQSPDSASNISTLVSIILGFISGAFVSFPRTELFLGLTVVDFFPTYHAAEALRKIMQFNQGFESIYLELSIIFLSSVVLYIAGSITYSKKKLDSYLSPT